MKKVIAAKTNVRETDNIENAMNNAPNVILLTACLMGSYLPSTTASI